MKFSSTTIVKRLLPILLLVAFLKTNAQSDLASPYTIFGPGIPNLRQTVSMAGAGGSGVALTDPYKLNFANPASVAYHAEPIFESSGKYVNSTFSTNLGSFDNNSFELNNINLSFPIIRGKWGLIIGLLPYTTIGYEVTTVADDEEVELQPISQYSGDGGISQGYLGMGYKFYNKIDSAGNVTAIAFGANVNYNFGTLNAERMNSFPFDTEARGVKSDESIVVKDWSVDFGLHYQKNIVKRTISNPRYLKFLAGLSYSLETNLNTERSEFAYTFIGTSGLNLSDTLRYSDREAGSITLPQRFTLGLGLDYVSVNKTRLRFSTDYTLERWSEYQVSYNDDNLSFDFQDGQRYSAGLEFTPKLGSSKYFETVEYRAGFHYNRSNLNLRDQDIEDIGMSFGLTLPIHHRRAITQSSFSIGAVYGKSGTQEMGLIQEDYIRIFVGFSFTPHFRNKWFVQPKYD